MSALAPLASSVATTVLSALLEARTGQQLANYRAWRLDTALKPLLRQRGLDTLDQLVAELLGGTEPRLGDRIVDALLNGESSFFRDAAVFDEVGRALTECGTRRARIWCAGCATGQEPFSLAMMLAEAAEAHGRAMPEIVATDVSDTALARARAGRFNQFEVQRGLAIRRLMRWFEGDGTADWAALPELLRLVRFQRMNLVADAAPAGRFDIVLCRNVLLYIAPAAKPRVYETLAAALRPGGLLVLGAGETVIGQTTLFVPSGRHRGLYERVAADRAAA